MTATRGTNPVVDECRLAARDIWLAAVLGLVGSWWLAYLSLLPSGSQPAGAGLLLTSLAIAAFALREVLLAVPAATAAARRRFGDHDPKGKMYAPTSRLSAIRDQARTQQVSLGLHDDPLQALVIRANEGDCVEIRYTNTATGGDYGMHLDGLEFTSSSSGDSIGTNTSSAVQTGKSATYRFAVPNDARMEGAHYIHPGPGYRSAVDHGLFGALVIEPPGSTYWNASAPNQPLESGWEAIIKPCPPGSLKLEFSVTAMDTRASFSGARTAFVRTADATAIKRGTQRAEPLVLHVAAGECVTVHLTNRLSTAVGFSVGKLDRGAGSGGVNVGFAAQQNTAPNATRDYVYHVGSDRIGTAAIADLAGPDTMKSGLYEAVVVAPASGLTGQRITFTDPITGAPRDIGTQMLVHVPGATTPDYRDFTAVLADDDPKIGQNFMPYPTNAKADKALINYQAAPAGDGPGAFRNPGSVPYLTSFVGDPEVVHALVAPGSENAHLFSLGGLNWPEDPFLDNSNWVSARGLGPWESINAWVVGGAGGSLQAPGDYFYGDLRRPFTQAGMWGIQRVLPAAGIGCPIRRVNNSTC